MEKEDTYPKVAIVIVNYNSQDFIERFLCRLLENTHYRNYEILVVDNASSDKSPDIIRTISKALQFRGIKIHLLRLSKNYGYTAAATMAGMLAAEVLKANLLVFLNPDVIVTPGWLEEIVREFMRDPKLGTASPAMLNPTTGNIFVGGSLFLWSLPAYYYTKYNSLSKLESPRYILWCSGACLATRSNVFKNLNGFDKKFFMYFDEIDYCWRVWILGYRVRIIPSSIIIEYRGGSLSTLDIFDRLRMRIYYNSKNGILTLAKCHALPRIRYLSVLLFCTYMLTISVVTSIKYLSLTPLNYFIKSIVDAIRESKENIATTILSSLTCLKRYMLTLSLMKKVEKGVIKTSLVAK